MWKVSVKGEMYLSPSLSLSLSYIYKTGRRRGLRESHPCSSPSFYIRSPPRFRFILLRLTASCKRSWSSQCDYIVDAVVDSPPRRALFYFTSGRTRVKYRRPLRHNGGGYHSKGRRRDARSFCYSTTVHGIQFNLTFSTRNSRE